MAVDVCSTIVIEEPREEVAGGIHETGESQGSRVSQEAVGGRAGRAVLKQALYPASISPTWRPTAANTSSTLSSWASVWVAM